ncbi:Glucuronosyltransferase [Aphelenchoides fujianensis]|nr:Glucuronosyltransferase [Aphelenchoides fujianensis]
MSLRNGRLFLISCLLLGFVRIHGFEVTLFASTGCFSHDATTREIGHEFGGQNVTWMQMRAYLFELAPVQLPAEWRQVVVDRLGDTQPGEEGRRIEKLGGPLIWETNVPTDLRRPLDLRGTFLFYNILELHHRFCGEFVQSPVFKRYLEEKRADLVECMMGAAAVLNTTTVKFSNWPLADGYMSGMNVPANPAVVPKTGTPFSSLGMTFDDRVRNAIFHVLIAAARSLQVFIVRDSYTRWGHPNIDLDEVQARHLLYAGRSEFLVEPLRPLSNRVKSFGCSKCEKEKRLRDPTAAIPAAPLAAAHPRFSVVLDVRNAKSPGEPDGRPLHVELLASNRGEAVNATRPSISKDLPSILQTLSSANLSEAEERYVRTLAGFPELELLEEGPFVLVSFGSVAETKYMPDERLDEFLRSFSSIVPAAGVVANEQRPREDQQPPPTSAQFDPRPLDSDEDPHRNLQFVVSHGGVNTVNELLLFGVPVLGVPLQGDQTSNLQRLVELGVASLSSIHALQTPGTLLEELRSWRRWWPTTGSSTRAPNPFVCTGLYATGRRLQSADGFGVERRFFEHKLRPTADYLAVWEVATWSLLLASTVCILTR